jgi:serine/threonine-protein kinase
MSQESERPSFRRMRRHFEALVELGPAERRDRLAHWDRRDPALARELRALLAADAAPPGLLDGNALVLLEELLTPDEPETERTSALEPPPEEP